MVSAEREVELAKQIRNVNE
ncbi:hypothetical protein [Aestuariivivens sp. NBU2969]